MTSETPENTPKPASKTAAKSDAAYRTISEVAEMLDLQQHVLRFWETKFTQIKPLKRGGNRRFYRPQDVEMIQALKILLHRDGYTIRGVQKLFREQGVKPTIQATLEGGPAEQMPIIPALDKRISSAAVPRRTAVQEDQPPTQAEAPASNEDPDQLKVLLSELKEIRALLD